MPFYSLGVPRVESLLTVSCNSRVGELGRCDIATYISPLPGPTVGSLAKVFESEADDHSVPVAGRASIDTFHRTEPPLLVLAKSATRSSTTPLNAANRREDSQLSSAPQSSGERSD
jgi:hypothetical protein